MSQSSECFTAREGVAAARLTPTSSVNCKPELRVSAEGGKLTFNLLEEMQGDSSLEPGEVITPPHTSQELASEAERAPSPSPPPMPVALAVAECNVPKLQATGKPAKSASQLEAEACQEKVRAILEIDAIKKRAEIEKRKEQLEKRRRSGEADEDAEAKRKAKEERKRLKRLKKEQEAARRALMSDYEDDEEESDKTRKRNSSSDERSDEMRVGCLSAARYAGSTSGPVQHMPTFHGPFMGFRPLNPFIRGGHSDMHVARGGAFMPRMRGGMRGMRFPGFCAPYFAGGSLVGPQRHMNPQQRHHTPPPPRGHSPIKAPKTNLIWTSTKPSISYAFNSRTDYKTKSTEHSAENTATIKSKSSEKRTEKTKDRKQHNKSKRKHERQKVKKRRSIRNSSERSSQRKIDKIRKSMVAPMRKRTPQAKLQGKLTLPTEIIIIPDTPRKPKATVQREKLSEFAGAEIAMGTMPSFSLVKETTANVEQTPESVAEVAKPAAPMGSEALGSFVSFKIDSKTRARDKNVLEGIEAKEHDDQGSPDAKSSADAFDMFAESPPRHWNSGTRRLERSAERSRAAAERDICERIEANSFDLGSFGEPAAKKSKSSPAETKVSVSSGCIEQTPLQKALDVQRRIDQLLQDDDLNLETIQASKEKLLQQTKQHAAASQAVKASVAAKELQQVSLHAPPKLPRTPLEMPAHNNPFRHSSSLRDRQRVDSRRPSRTRSHSRSRSQSRILERRSDSKRKAHTHDWNRSESKRMSSKSRYSGSSTDSLHRWEGRKERNRSNETVHDSVDASDRHRDVHQTPPRRSGSDTKHFLPHSPQRDERSSSKSTPTALKNDVAESPKKSSAKSKFDKPEAKKKSKLDAAKAQKKLPPLSFAPDEFLFPEESENGESYSDEVGVIVLKTTPPAMIRNEHDDARDDFSQTPKTEVQKEAERAERECSLDVAELEADAADDGDDDDGLTGFDFAPEVHSDSFEKRFINPSPPVELLRFQQEQAGLQCPAMHTPRPSTTKDSDEGTATARSPPSVPTAFRPGDGKELFGMQELYDQFIKSVEEAGVDMKTTTPAAPATSAATPTKMDVSRVTQQEDECSRSSSSSSSSASTSEATTTTTSSSSSSNSSSDDSDDAASGNGRKRRRHYKKKSARKQRQSHSPPNAASCMELARPLSVDIDQQTSMQELPSIMRTPPRETLPGVVIGDATTPPPVLPLHGMPSLTDISPSKKSDATKDFKKLKNLEANLSRIKTMYANYDSADEIRDELLKMGRLFQQEKNRILQKYTRTPAAPLLTPIARCVPVSVHQTVGAAEAVTGNSVHSLQQAVPAAVAVPSTPPTQVPDKIFDVNREAIKLKISPLKLPKTPAIFETAAAEKSGGETTRHIATAEPEGDVDFTEKLIKPAKEIAIVKPMMETKEALVSHSLRRSPKPPPSSSSRSHRDHSHTKRSTSRSRYSPRRRSRASSSRSPVMRRVSGSGHHSPHRRSDHPAQTRRRSFGRRSRSRSITRPSSRRSGDHSPPHHRSNNRRRPAPSGPSLYRRSGQHRRSRSHSSRQHSPRSPRPHSPLSPRPRSPRSPPPSSPHRRSPRPQSSHRRRPLSSCSPRAHSPRSPRAYSPRPHSPLSPRPRSPCLLRPRSQRPHSPRSPPPTRRRSYDRDLYSRSPLPFKPPSPPARRSSSRDSLPRRGRFRALSPRRPRSPKSTPPPSAMDYEEYRRLGRDSSFDGRPMTPQSPYFGQNPMKSGAHGADSSPYYYGGPQTGNGAIGAPYDYTNIAQFGSGAYMPLPSHASPSGANNYYGSQFLLGSNCSPASSSSNRSSPLVPVLPQQQMYSNIPTIGSLGGSGGGVPSASHFFYNEYGGHTVQTSQSQHRQHHHHHHHQHSSHQDPAHHHQHQPHQHQSHQHLSLLKELPKATTVAVQKGNVLEIVPSNEKSSSSRRLKSQLNAPITPKIDDKPHFKPIREKSKLFSWQNEVKNRQAKTEIMRVNRDMLKGTRRGILKSTANLEPETKHKEYKKRVYFEDGLYPARDSDDEDRLRVETKMRAKIRRLRKDAAHSNKRSKQRKIILKMKKLPPPPPPLGGPPPDVPQPICLRPSTPQPKIYYHFDRVVHSMYVSAIEEPFPPRLHDPKWVPPAGGGTATIAASSSHHHHYSHHSSQSHYQHGPYHNSGVLTSSSSSSHGSKKDLSASNSHQRYYSPSLRNGRASPSTSSSYRRDASASHMKTAAGHSTSADPYGQSGKGTFQTSQSMPSPTSSAHNSYQSPTSSRHINVISSRMQQSGYRRSPSHSPHVVSNAVSVRLQYQKHSNSVYLPPPSPALAPPTHNEFVTQPYGAQAPPPQPQPPQPQPPQPQPLPQPLPQHAFPQFNASTRPPSPLASPQQVPQYNHRHPPPNFLMQMPPPPVVRPRHGTSPGNPIMQPPKPATTRPKSMMVAPFNAKQS